MPTLRTPSPVGHTIAARYELVELIGRGGHGVVFRARDRLTGEDVAVKMLTDVAAQDPALVERLKREQQILAQLSGTSAVRVIDLCASPNGRLCLVMELLQGIDLEQRLQVVETRGERLPVAEVVRIFEPIVDTLEQAHRGGILHRDLKPANIFLLDAGGVRLLDFGLARIRQASPLTAAGTIVGSPSYIAPEVWQGRPDAVDQRVDVYSLGVIVYRVLTGHLPFEVDSLRDKFIAATSAPRPSLWAWRRDLPAAIDDWVQLVLAIDKNARFDSVRAAWNALGGALGVNAAPAVEAPVVEETAVEEPAVLSSRILEVGVATPSVFSAPAPEKSLVADMLARSDLAVEPMTTVEVAPGLFDAGLPAGERSLVSEWLAASALAPEAAADVDQALGLPEPLPQASKRRRKKKPRLPGVPGATQPVEAKPAKRPAKKKSAKKKAPAKKKAAKPSPAAKQKPGARKKKRG